MPCLLPKSDYCLLQRWYLVLWWGQAYLAPQNMAQVANGSALLVAWLITGVGIIFLALSLLHLTRQRPDLDGGIYNYAREGFGDLIGFCSAWGYWLCTTIGIVGYVVIAFSGVGMFTDSKDHVIFGEGNTLYSLIGSSILYGWCTG